MTAHASGPESVPTLDHASCVVSPRSTMERLATIVPSIFGGGVVGCEGCAGRGVSDSTGCPFHHARNPCKSEFRRLIPPARNPPPLLEPPLPAPVKGPAEEPGPDREGAFSSPAVFEDGGALAGGFVPPSAAVGEGLSSPADFVPGRADGGVGRSLPRGPVEPV